ncbi:MAG: hypothetical protein WCD57_05375 [Acidobacteriaceae bacterium]
MDLRQQRGMELAATRTIRRKGQTWMVPSQVDTGVYSVNISSEQPTCSCREQIMRALSLGNSSKSRTSAAKAVKRAAIYGPTKVVP